MFDLKQYRDYPYDDRSSDFEYLCIGSLQIRWIEVTDCSVFVTIGALVYIIG